MEPKTVRRALGAGFPARHIAPEDACNALPTGMVVLTLDGALPVEFLNEGDRVISRNSGVATLTSIRRCKRRVEAVAIKPGTLGVSRPDRDALIPARQEVLVRDWRAATLFGASQALVPAARLIDGEFIRSVGEVDLDLFEMHFDNPHILYADGLELASATPASVMV
ncbi:MAG: Hint domain-containing protein [Pelagimonas sp.]|uniref:Hint domain-containing protein n=1 Tax=Pelagimonas sp. TaxID=2073170 RepID=UPI003D6A79B5